MNISVTKKDVAKLAGVSHMTVSRVLSDSPYVSQKTRKKVLRTCRKLKYRQNMIALSLRSRRSYALGVIVPSFEHTFYARFLNRVEAKCKETGYHIIIIQAGGRNTSPVQWSDVEFLLTRQIDGLLVIAQFSSKILRRLKKERLPVVFVDISPLDDGFSFVGTADFEGSKELTNYLIQLGHRRIAFLAGHYRSYTSRQRLAGYKSALSENKLPFSQELVCYTTYSIDTGYQSMLKLLSRKRIFSAVVGANDYVAIGALSACNEKGIKVPGKVSIVGFTGDKIGAYTAPPLTTMVQPIEEIGTKAVEILLRQMKNSNHPAERVLLPARLMERGSAGPVEKK